MSKGIQIIKENNNLAEWSRQVEECRNSGLSVRSWCEQHKIAVSTFHYRQQKVWKALQKSSQFIEVPLSFDESNRRSIFEPLTTSILSSSMILTVKLTVSASGLVQSNV